MTFAIGINARNERMQFEKKLFWIVGFMVLILALVFFTSQPQPPKSTPNAASSTAPTKATTVAETASSEEQPVSTPQPPAQAEAEAANATATPAAEQPPAQAETEAAKPSSHETTEDKAEIVAQAEPTKWHMQKLTDGSLLLIPPSTGQQPMPAKFIEQLDSQLSSIGWTVQQPAAGHVLLFPPAER
jgi:cytoskeletal protein RodZ